MPITAREFQTDDYPLFVEGEWSLDPVVSSVSGLSHLAGQTVEIFADGSDFGTAEVSAGGVVNLDQPASHILIGLGFDGFAEALPLSVSDGIIEDRAKRIVGLSIRIEDTRGLYYGVNDIQYPVKERTDEAARAPTRFQNGIRKLTARADWSLDDTIRFEKRGPSVSSILSLIADVEIGDDDD